MEQDFTSRIGLSTVLKGSTHKMTVGGGVRLEWWGQALSHDTTGAQEPLTADGPRWTQVCRLQLRDACKPPEPRSSSVTWDKNASQQAVSKINAPKYWSTEQKRQGCATGGGRGPKAPLRLLQASSGHQWQRTCL